MFHLHMSKREREELSEYLQNFSSDEKIQAMKKFTAHGSISVYSHSIRVAKLSYYLNRRLHAHCSEAELMRGAMLHDFYLYDWHAWDNGTHRLHGFTHPEIAEINADKEYHLSDKEKNIIRCHMWPLTLFHMPACREAWIVSLADKIASADETVRLRSAQV